MLALGPWTSQAQRWLALLQACTRAAFSAPSPRGARPASAPLTVDGLPLVGPVPGAPGAYLATAHASWGILSAPATGRMIGEVILEGGSRSLDAAPFAVSRLPAGRVVSPAG